MPTWSSSVWRWSATSPVACPLQSRRQSAHVCSADHLRQPFPSPLAHRTDMPSTLPSARLAHALLACGLAASTARGQALATGDLRTSTTTPVEARSTLALGLPLNRGSDLLLKAGLDGAGWLGAGGPGKSKGYAAANLIIALEGGRGERCGWLRVEATGWLTPQLGVVVGVGSPSLPLLEAPRLSGPFTLGFRLAFGRAARPVVARPPPKRENPSFEIRSVSGDLRLLRVRVPDALRVELTADFVDWRVVSLVPAGGGVWEAQLAIGPGSHRVSIRRDGGPWAVPPGLPAVADDFTGAAGLLRVE